MQEIK